MKAKIGIGAAFLALCTLLYLSVPSSWFQFPEVEEAEVSRMTALAREQERLYTLLDALTRSEADKIVAELSQGYDDAVVETNLHFINHYWLIAIFSVLQEQSLEAGEPELRALIAKNLEYSWDTEDYEEEVGLDAQNNPILEPRTRILIQISNTGPDQLMNALSFTEFQREWASFLYGNLSDSQVISPDWEDWPGELRDYGDLVFREGSREVVYYNQTDARWGYLMYGEYHNVAAAGCGPTSLAMAVSSLTDRVIDPAEMTAWAYENGYCAEGNGSYHSLIPNGAEHFGLKVTKNITDAQDLVDALADGKLIIVIMGPGHFTVSGHFIVLRGITSEGKVLVADPVSIRKTGMEWDMGIILSEAKSWAAAGGPFWILEEA